MADSTLYPGTQRRAYRVRYPSDNGIDDFEDAEVRPLLVTSKLRERLDIVAGITPAFDYLESRILGTCDAQYSCSHMYQVMSTHNRAHAPTRCTLVTVRLRTK